jgi:hypothetical protein
MQRNSTYSRAYPCKCFNFRLPSNEGIRPNTSQYVFVAAGTFLPSHCLAKLWHAHTNRWQGFMENVVLCAQMTWRKYEVSNGFVRVFIILRILVLWQPQRHRSDGRSALNLLPLLSGEKWVISACSQVTPVKMANGTVSRSASTYRNVICRGP